MLKSMAALFALALFLSPSAMAADTPPNKAQQLFKVMQADKSQNQTFKMLTQRITPMVIQGFGQDLKRHFPQATEAQRQETSEAFAQGFHEMMQATMPEVEKQMAELYSNAFTEQELDQLIAFYQTETGQKFVQLQGKLAKQGAMVTQQQIQKNMQHKLPTIMQTMVDQLEKQLNMPKSP
ncbi:DUF2059 domain-containing protein [Magnetococcus sp. PR-3]|uniref:DUF2059 domain-containing protein n=1 Tax=Magnetococcus sp. PR-3 TaxID=3120355 RepID=UPI002FCDEAF9